ncbi:MAG TPA: FtsK/SpoIIIE domain-containing protein [Solirubrobacteraceae bacterium]|jgi:S-DNA-T family DNA segregation ATPase FtsK/SpoIIIE
MSVFASAERRAEQARVRTFVDQLEKEQERRAKAVEKEQARRARRTKGTEDAPTEPDLITRLALRVPTAVWGALVGALVLVVGVEGLHQHAARLWPLPLVLGGAAAALLWTGVRATGVLPLPFGGALPRRAILPGAVALLSIWTASAWLVGIDRALLFLLAVGTGAGVVVAFRRTRRPQPKARAERDPADIVANWGALTEVRSPISGALGGSAARVHARDDVGWTIRVELAAAHTADELVALARNIESAFRIRRGALRVVHHEDAHVALLRAVTRDVLARSTRWTEPQSTTVLDPVRLGTFEDGAPALLRLVPEAGRGISLLIAGKPGSGKSGLLNVLVAAWGACTDLVLAGVDCQGTELRGWADVFEPSLLALDAGQEAKQVLARLLAVMAARQGVLRERGLRYWTPTPEEPEVVLVIDELADLDEDDLADLDQIVRKGRKCGLHAVVATQRPTNKALSSWGGELKAKLGGSICLQVATPAEVNLVLGGGAAGGGWRADQILHRPGEFLIATDDPEHQTVRRARALLVTDSDVTAWAARCAPNRPSLDEASAAAVEGADGV